MFNHRQNVLYNVEVEIDSDAPFDSILEMINEHDGSIIGCEPLVDPKQDDISILKLKFPDYLSAISFLQIWYDEEPSEWINQKLQSEN